MGDRGNLFFNIPKMIFACCFSLLLINYWLSVPYEMD